jgi:hypothetical protein
MPETPDFESIAEACCYFDEADDVPETDARRAKFVGILKSISNARGAADIATIEAELPGPTSDRGEPSGLGAAMIPAIAATRKQPPAASPGCSN